MLIKKKQFETGAHAVPSGLLSVVRVSFLRPGEARPRVPAGTLPWLQSDQWSFPRGVKGAHDAVHFEAVCVLQQLHLNCGSPPPREIFHLLKENKRCEERAHREGSSGMDIGWRRGHTGFLAHNGRWG